MTTHITKSICCIALLTLASLLVPATTAQAAIVGPYTVDANTMHLFHFEDSANPVLDDPGVTNDYSLDRQTTYTPEGQTGTVGHASFTGFGNAGRTNRACCGNNTGIGSEERGWSEQGAVTAANLYGSDTTAFTIEMMLKFNQVGDNDFVGILQSQTGDLKISYNATGGNHLNFTVPGGAGTYITDALTIDTSKWYHAAFVYDGFGTTTNNVRIYFTEMDDANTEANLVNTFSTGAGPSNYVTSSFWLGAPGGGQINGLYDELRISNIARGADDMMFSGAVPEPSSIALAGLGLLGLAGYGVRRRRNK